MALTKTTPIYEDDAEDDIPLLRAVPTPHVRVVPGRSEVTEGRGRGVSVSAEVAVRHPTCARIVAGFNSNPKAKLGVILLWGALGLAGLAVLEPFLNNLVSSIDPVEGTQSYAAAAALSSHFPVDAAAMDNGIAALMVESRAAAGSPALPLFNFTESSTCTLGLSPANVTAWVDSLASNATAAHWDVRQLQATLELGVVCTPHRPDALGAGCITKEDMHVQLLITALEAAEKALPVFTALCDTHPTGPGPLATACDVLLPYLNNSDAIREFYHEVAWVEHIAPMIPNITLCPVSTNQTARWLATSQQANRTLAESAVGCTVTVISLDTLAGESLPVPTVNLSLFAVNATVALPPGSLWQLFSAQVATPDNMIVLNEFQLHDCDGGRPIGGPLDSRVKAFSEALKTVVSNAATGDWLSVRGSSKYLLLAATQEGVDQTMNLSAMTVPLALAILVMMVKNVRLVACTVVNLGACTAVSGLAMYIVGGSMVVSTLAPSMMLAIAMAMSIDYSLFLLSRFQNEMAAGRSVVDAVVVMMATSGKIVLVSGGTLLLCFTMMLVLPVSLIRSLGVSAAVTVFMAVAAALTLTPAAILLLPRFFSSTRRFGITLDGIDCTSCRRHRGGGGGDGGGGSGGERGIDGDMLSVEEKLGAADEALVTSWWCAFGRAMQRRWVVVFVALLAIAVPVGAVALSEFRIAIGLLPLLPRDGDATQTLVDLQDAFGGGAIFPTTIVVVPPAHATATAAGREQWLLATCHELQSVAQWVDPGPPAPAFTAEAFAGLMMVNGTCVSEQLVPKFVGGWSTGYTATSVRVTYNIDPFSPNGQDWTRQLRNATGSGTPTAQTGSTYYITSEGANQMDAAEETFNRFPLMIGLMMATVLVLIGGSFMSVVAPVRAVFCLVWMLTVTMGLSIFTFQSGMLDGLHLAQFAARPSGAMSWFSPSIALPILIGLGLDYDIFFTEKVAEERENGFSEKEASVRALAATANLISAAGAIMVVAFMSVLLSGTAALNEIAFMLTVGILIDCFVTTKMAIPASIGFTGGRTFWPRRFDHKNPHASAVAVAMATVQCQDTENP